MAVVWRCLIPIASFIALVDCGVRIPPYGGHAVWLDTEIEGIPISWDELWHRESTQFRLRVLALIMVRGNTPVSLVTALQKVMEKFTGILYRR